MSFQAFLKAYWNKQPDEIPDQYSRPAGEPVTVFVSPDLYKKIQGADGGLRLSKDEETKLVEKKDLVYGKKRSGWVPEIRNRSRVL